MRIDACVTAAALLVLPRAATAQGPVRYGTTQNQRVISAFVGSTFGGRTVDSSIDFGGQLAYLWRGVIGAEALADFTRSIKLDNSAAVDRLHVNSYMGNVVFALPLGAEGQLQPYLSGGIGGIQVQTRIGTLESDTMKFGSDLGGGLMGFAGTIGFRADVRHYKAATDTTFNSTSAVGQFTEGLLSGLDFWRANIGVAVRW